MRALQLVLHYLYQEMSWILLDKFGSLLETEPLFPPEVINLDTVIAHWKSLACIIQEARLGGNHGPFYQGDLRGSEHILGQIM